MMHLKDQIPELTIEKRNKSIERAADIWKPLNVPYDIQQQKEMHSRINRDERQIFFINCWHFNEHESSAMWKIYSKEDEGIAIQTTFKRLCSSFKEFDRIIWIGKVKYIDYSKEDIPDTNSLNKFLYKRKSFEYESEIRAIIQPLDPELKIPYHMLDGINTILEKQGRYKKGIDVDVDLNCLIDKIYVSPTSEEWYIDLVKAITAKYQLNIEVKPSDLVNKSPLF
jgi:hypothetical protein